MATKKKQEQAIKFHTREQTIQERILTFRFYPHFHPYVKELITELIEKSIPGLQAADTDFTNELMQNGQPKPRLYEEFFEDYYDPINEKYVPAFVEGSERFLHPVKDLDFRSNGAYAVYNWELFFHVPFTIAVHLSKNQRFADAMRWFHYIFDPGDDSDGLTPERYWKVKPFKQTDVKLIEEVLVNLSSDADPELRRDTVNSIEAWKNSPFSPHTVARYRQTAYMYKVIMAYLDNLLDWGDALFRQDTGESINEATQLYVLAANILGPRPQAVPKKVSVKPQTYDQLRKDLDEFGNALIELEVEIPFLLTPAPGPASNNDQPLTLRSIGKTLFFCVPRNNKLLGYWGAVADRLYKIHNSLNLQGVFRQLPLFEPPIDPAMLARAAAAGLDVGAVISGLNQPLPLVRFRYIVQKANEICREVKALGSGVLSALEKEDGEALSLLRAKHESSLMQMIEGVRYAQWQEAIKTREGLEVSLKNSIRRYTHYEKLLGENDVEVPSLNALDKTALEKQSYASEEPELEPREISYDFFTKLLDAAGMEDLNFLRLNTPEGLAIIFDASTIPLEVLAVGMDIMGGMLTIIPEFEGSIEPVGIGGAVKMDGKQIGQILQLLASATRGGNNILKTMSGISSTIGSHMRRKQDWELQSQQMAGEINQIYKQLVAAQIREYVSKKEYENHKIQIKNAEDILSFLEGEKVNSYQKTTTQGFYTYLKRELKGLYNNYFQFAYDIAKKAERALQHELGNPSLNYLQFNYLAGKEGLYAGEKLAFDLKRMETAYLDMNKRELELTKHVSLLQISPQSLLQLRLTGKCTVSIPEEVFDMGGCEGHYFRRIKSVALTIPCVTGPYTSINCTLTLTKNSIRKKSNLLEGVYARQENDTDRFSDDYRSTSIVTSSAQNDAGLFEFNLHDERYLPFEYAGVISEWQLELSNEFRTFDYNSISDVIFHFNYTARQGGGLLKERAIDNLRTLINEKGQSRFFSLRHEFPTEWDRFVSSDAGPNGRYPLAFELKEKHYPFWSKGLVNSIRSIEIFALGTNGDIEIFKTEDAPDTEKLLIPSENNPAYRIAVSHGIWDEEAAISLPPSLGDLTIFLNTNEIQNLWMIVNWSGEEG